MKRDETATSVNSVSKPHDSSTPVFYALADTTWRVAVPTLLFSGFGIFLDKTFEVVPLFTLIGLVVGLIAAGMLVWYQLQMLGEIEGQK